MSQWFKVYWYLGSGLQLLLSSLRLSVEPGPDGTVVVALPLRDLGGYMNGLRTASPRSWSISTNQDTKDIKRSVEFYLRGVFF